MVEPYIGNINFDAHTCEANEATQWLSAYVQANSTKTGRIQAIIRRILTPHKTPTV